jgi:hypothetical protein
MFYVIESQSHVDELFQNELNTSDNIFLHVIKSQPLVHNSISNTVSLIYIFQVNMNKGYIICINHNETFKVDIDYIIKYLNSFNIIYCIDRPLVYQTIPEIKSKLIDLSIVNWLCNGKRTEMQQTPCHAFYEKLMGKTYYNLNEIIPVSKHYEVIESFKNKHIYTFITQYRDIDKKIYRYYTLLQDTLTLIEKNPIGLDLDKFNTYFKPNNLHNSINGSEIYTKYHFFTLTSRPQNNFNGINFNSISKDNNSRESFIPLNDIFIEIDFNAYHIQLISQLIDYQFNPNLNIYDQLLEEYKIINPNIATREDVKKVTLIQINNGISTKYQDIEFFKKYSEYVDILWNKYTEGSIPTDPITGRSIVYSRSDTSKYKLMSYMLQSYETSNNIRILYTLVRSMEKIKSNIVMYNYDSFLIDACREEFQEIINNIIPIISGNKFVTNISIGSDYNNLRRLK